MANNSSWLNISQVSGGTGETALSLTALTNNTLSAKTATVTAKNTTYNVQDTTTVTIQAFEPTLTLSRSTLRFDKSGGTATFTVYSNTAWTINFPSLVYGYSTSAGTGDTEITVVLAENLDEVSKVDVGTVQDCFNVNQLYLTIVQESFIVELVVWPQDDIEFVNTGSSSSITIDSNADWNIECPDWVTPSIASGQSGVSFVTLTANWNSGSTDRGGYVTVYSGSKYVTIRVHQMNYIEPYLTVVPKEHTFPTTESSVILTVNSYPGWTAEIVSTAETLWGSDIAMEVIVEVPSAVTVNLGRSGTLVNGVYVPGTEYTFLTAGTYSVQYPYVDGSTGVLSGNPYITKVIIGDTIESIESSAFYNCTILSSITIGSGLTEIGDYAFNGCSSLNEINIDAEYAPIIGQYTFGGVATGGTLNYPYGSNYNFWLQPTAYYLGYYQWPGYNGQDYILAEYDVKSTTAATTILGATEDPNFNQLWSRIVVDNGDELSPFTTTYTFTRTGLHTVKFYPLTDSVNTPQSYGRKGIFQGCTDLVSVVFGDIIRETGHNCVSDCPSLTSVTLNEGMQIIGGYFEQNSPNLHLLANTANWPRTVRVLGDGNLQGENFTSFVIPNGVTSIGRGCFSGCSSLSSITFPNSVTTLGEDAFNNCDSLTSVTLPNLTGMFNAFNGCGSLTSIEIPEGITKVGGQYGYGDGISDCSSLTSVTFPSTLQTIGGYFLSGDDSLIRIYSKAMSPGNDGRAFGNFNHNYGILFVPPGANYSAWWNSDRYGQSLSGHNWTIMTWGLVADIGKSHFTWKSNSTSITIETPSGWTASSNSAWVTLSDTSGGDGHSVIDVTIDTNVQSAERTAVITIVSGEETRSFNVTQDGLVLQCTVSSIDFKSGVRRTNMTITSPANWTVSSNKGWISFSQNSGGTGETTVTVTADAYSGTNDRTGLIYIMTVNDQITIPVKQSSAKDYITVTYSASTTAGTKLYNTATAASSNFSAYSIDDAEWVDLSSNNTYSFPTTGLHTVRYKLIDTSIIQYPVFKDCTEIVELDLADCPIVTIGNTTISDSESNSKGSVFSGCTALTGVSLPASLVTLGSAIFQNCYNVETYHIPASVVKIGHYCFSHRGNSGASQTTAVTIGDANGGSNLAKVYMCIFEGCSKLHNIYSYGMTNAPGCGLGSETPGGNYSTYVFNGIKKYGVLHIPAESNYSQWLSGSSYWLGYNGWTSRIMEN